MIFQKHPFFTVLVLFLCLAALLSGCSNSGEDSNKKSEAYSPGQVNVLSPRADGKNTLGGEPLLLDLSNISQGYIMGILKEEGKKINIQIIGPDGVTYKYFLTQPGIYTAFPLTAGDGTYLILAFENVSADQYASLFSESVDVSLDNEFLPFLYPNQYVNFDEDTSSVRLAAELSEDADTDLKALENIYNYIITNISYDSRKAALVEAGYLPDIDSTLSTKTGICFDYAALMASMLRSLGIPTKLTIGYSASVRHAWVDVYIESEGWIEHAVEFNGNEWRYMDPTFASTGSDDPAILEYIGDGKNYIVQYIR